MGIEIEVNSLEDMCDLMCNNKIPPKKEVWIFTFGIGHENAGHYVKIEGTYESARQKMFDRFGDKWAFQYSEKEWKNLKHATEKELIE